ncbi:MAG: hypothetical protein N3I35_14330 [Clostridia bacterium]|nr:hypothetical protein [Clostridia bacterium]
MFKMFKKAAHASKRNFDRKVLRKNDISILILDERWNKLFVNTEKTPEIFKCEEKLKELLKEQARLTAETKEIALRKKNCIERIMQLTTEAYEKNNEEAKNEMQECEKEIKRINERMIEIEEGLDNIPDLIKEANLELLEHTVNIVYFKMRSNQLRVKELEQLIEEARKNLQEYIDEKGTISEDDTDIYSYFHDLLGGEELEKLDKEFFSQ